MISMEGWNGGSVHQHLQTCLKIKYLKEMAPRMLLFGQIIATSHNLTPNGGLVREIPLFQGNLGWWNIIIWPAIINRILTTYSKYPLPKICGAPLCPVRELQESSTSAPILESYFPSVKKETTGRTHPTQRMTFVYLHLKGSFRKNAPKKPSSWLFKRHPLSIHPFQKEIATVGIPMAWVPNKSSKTKVAGDSVHGICESPGRGWWISGGSDPLRPNVGSNQGGRCNQRFWMIFLKK